MKTLGAAGAAAAMMAVVGSPVQAQDEDYRAIVIIMRACAQIDDIAARVTCYDNTIAPRAAPPARGPESRPSQAPVPAAPVANDFGAENLPEVRQAERDNRGADEIVRRVSRAEEVEPRLYLLTLEDGSQWRFSESMGLSYFPPGPRSEVRIERGALGSYRLYADGQRAVRVVRVR